MERQERVWISSWAAVSGFSLLLLHNWILSLNGAGPYLKWIWPLYIIATIPPLTMQILSRYRTDKKLWIMAASFSLIMAGAASYLGHQTWNDVTNEVFSYDTAGLLAFLTLVCWFVLLSFAEHKLQRNTWWEDYALLFSTAWSNSVKLITSATFTVLFWCLLFLWAGLFKILNVSYFFDLFTDRVFVYPVTAIVFGLGLSLYAAKEEALMGINKASLNVLGWLLPLVIFIAVLFLVALPFQGLGPLWDTGYATPLMLALLVAIVFLFNCVWQDGSNTLKFPPWLFNFIQAGLLAMPLYIGLSAYSISLRIVQHGWSIDRIWGVLAIVVLGIYAFGYAAASLASLMRKNKVWMGKAKGVNITAALVVVALLILTLTPVLNPARIAVDNQVSRLLADKIGPKSFDYQYLRFKTGKYGYERLQELAKEVQHPQAKLIQEEAESTLQLKNYRYSRNIDKDYTAEELSKFFVAYPSGAIQSGFLDFIANELEDKYLGLSCIPEKGATTSASCPLLHADLDGDGNSEYILLDGYGSRIYSMAGGNWKFAARLNGPNLTRLKGAELQRKLENNEVEILSSKWKDIRIGTSVFQVQSVD